ncbi:hypothetical protein FQN49_002520 [Arthroderma sp. PD_2]|nr:hypothetical protein FQN49_002520 [Arthroderma sp. PD_2]
MGVPLDGGEKWRAERAEKEQKHAHESTNKATGKRNGEPARSNETAREPKNEASIGTSSSEAGADRPHDSFDLDLDAFARSQEGGEFGRRLNSWLRINGLDPDELNR